MTRKVTTDVAPWYTRPPLLAGLTLAVVALLAGGWLLMGGRASPDRQKESVFYTTGRFEQTPESAPAIQGAAEGVVDSSMRVTLRVPWSDGSPDTALAAASVEMLDGEGNPARFGPVTGGAAAMRPAMEIGVWVYDGSMPSDPGNYHARFRLQRLNGPAETVEINEPELTAVAESGPPLESGYVFARSANLWLLSTDAQRERRLTFLSPLDEYADNPAWSPDGKQVAYTYSPKTASDQLPLTDIWVINGDGSNAHPIVQHAENESLLEPAWSPDGTEMYFTVRTEQPLSSTPTPLESELAPTRIDKIDIASGTRTQWMPNASMPGVGANGVVFVESRFYLDGDGYTVVKYRLKYANFEGAESRILVDENSFQSLYMPGISPDGKWVVFAAVNVPVQKPGGFDPWRLLTLQPETAHAHGLPWDLYLVPLAGGAPIQITQMNEDQPRPIWLDNTVIAFMGTTGLYKLDIDEVGSPVNAPTKIHSGAPHGGLTWHAP